MNSRQDAAKRALENSRRDSAKTTLKNSKRIDAQKQQINSRWDSVKRKLENSKWTDAQKQKIDILWYYKHDNSSNIVGWTKEIRKKRQAYATNLPGQNCKKYHDNYIYYSLHENLLVIQQCREQNGIWRKYQYCGVAKHGSCVSSEVFLKLTHKDLYFMSPLHCEAYPSLGNIGNGSDGPNGAKLSQDVNETICTCIADENAYIKEWS